MSGRVKFGFALVMFFAAGTVVSFSQNTAEYLVVMRNVGTDTMWDGQIINIFGFAPNILNPWLPGPLLTCNEGDSLKVRAWNISQGAPHTIHWHGLDVDMRNDGVHEFSFAVHHMEDCTYVFQTNHPGTYLYHCHVASVVHVQMGMYGAVVVKAAGGANNVWTGGPSYHQDKVWLTSEIDKSWHDTVPVHNASDSLFQEFAVPAYQPDYFLVNGSMLTQLSPDSSVHVWGMRNEKILVRLANIGFNGNYFVFPSHLDATILMSDGRPLPQSVRTDTVRVLPGERYEVMLQPSLEGEFAATVYYFDMDNSASLFNQDLPISIHGVIGVEEDLSSSYLSVWPNPTSGSFRMHWAGHTGGGTLQIVLRDELGRTMLNRKVNGAEGDWDSGMLDLPAGMYAVSVSGNDFNASRKLVVVR